MSKTFDRAWLITHFAPYDCAVPYSEIKTDDFIIAVDSGLERCLQLGLKPNLMIGDMDSVAPEQLKKISGKCETLTFPTEKNETDTQLAVEYCISHNIREIIICNDLGGRFDHSLALIQNLLQAQRNGIQATLASQNQIIRILSGSVTLSFPVGTLLSLLSITDQTEFIDSTGLAYPLNNVTLYNWQSRGISNVVTEPEQNISIGDGLALAIATV
jgi:thiamine pyrophosphokinase